MFEMKIITLIGLEANFTNSKTMATLFSWGDALFRDLFYNVGGNLPQLGKTNLCTRTCVCKEKERITTKGKMKIHVESIRLSEINITNHYSKFSVSDDVNNMFIMTIFRNTPKHIRILHFYHC